MISSVTIPGWLTSWKTFLDYFVFPALPQSKKEHHVAECRRMEYHCSTYISIRYQVENMLQSAEEKWLNQVGHLRPASSRISWEFSSIVYSSLKHFIVNPYSITHIRVSYRKINSRCWTHQLIGKHVYADGVLIAYKDCTNTMSNALPSWVQLLNKRGPKWFHSNCWFGKIARSVREPYG